MNGRNASRPGWPSNSRCRRRVGGGDHDDSAGEQRLEQAAQDQGVGDVSDLELVEAEQRRLGGDLVGERRDRVALMFPAPRVDAGVALLHERVEMDAAFAGDLGSAEEQVHQHGFPAADLADEVQAVRPFFIRPVHRPPAEQAGQQAGLCRMRIIPPEADPEGLQPLGGPGLGGLRVQGAGGDARAVGWQRTAGSGPHLHGRGQGVHGRAPTASANGDQ